MASLGPQRKTNLKQVVIETTRRCNLRCIHCKVSPENNEGSYDAIEMPIEVLRSWSRCCAPTVHGFS